MYFTYQLNNVKLRELLIWWWWTSDLRFVCIKLVILALEASYLNDFSPTFLQQRELSIIKQINQEILLCISFTFSRNNRRALPTKPIIYICFGNHLSTYTQNKSHIFHQQISFGVHLHIHTLYHCYRWIIISYISRISDPINLNIGYMVVINSM